MRFLLNLKPSTAHQVREQIEGEGAMWVNSWYALMKPFIWFMSYFAFYTYSEGSFRFRRLPLSGQFVYWGQKRENWNFRRSWQEPRIGLNFYSGDQNRDFGFQFGFILFTIYLTFENILPLRFQPQYKSSYNGGTMLPSSREFRLYYYNKSIWLNFWDNEDDHTAKQTWINQMHVFHFPNKYDWVRTSTLLKNQMWLNETKGSRKNWDFHKETEEILWKESHPYQYKLKSGEVQNVTATIGVSEREWRWRWFKWLPFPKKVSKTIDVDFSEEVGEERGSWKGGTLGCGYEMKQNETPLECLRRMEAERRFER